ncbi:hypothetical protein ES703_123713 [subsurface metagenome]
MLSATGKQNKGKFGLPNTPYEPLINTFSACCKTWNIFLCFWGINLSDDFGLKYLTLTSLKNPVT